MSAPLSPEEAAWAEAVRHHDAARSGCGAAVQRERKALAHLRTTVSVLGPAHLATVEAAALWESAAQSARGHAARVDETRTRVAAALRAWAAARAARMAGGAA